MSGWEVGQCSREVGDLLIISWDAKYHVVDVITESENHIFMVQNKKSEQRK